MFLIGVLVFTVASLTCGIAPGIEILIAARFVQGAGAAAMMPQIMSVIQVRFAGAARARALSAYTAVLSSGFVAGQVIGGVLVTANLFGQSWRPVFLVNVPIGLAVLALVPLVMPADVRAGLTFAPCAVVFGVCGYFWRRLPSGLHHLIAPLGCLVAVGGYAWVALVLHSGGRGGLVLQLALVVTGAALAFGFSPLVTHALVRVPLAQAADASGLLTTTIQLGQAVGVATFGSLFLTLDSGRAAAVSGHALAVTFGWLAAAMVFGVLAGIPLARTVAAARQA
jgi:MFS family permease